MTNPLIVMELRRDRVLRFWIASADDLAQRYIITEGHWRIDQSKLSFREMPITSPQRVASDLASKIEAISGWSLRSRRHYPAQRIRDEVTETFRLTDAFQLKTMSAQGKALTWKRPPGWKW
jgi:hypothetical protein